MPEMMTLEEIRTSKINPVVAREAYLQATARLSDILDTKKSFEQKAFILLNAYITVSTALFGAAGFISKGAYEVGGLAIPFVASGAVIAVGALFLVYALIDLKYGALGSDPKMWLTAGTIDSTDDEAFRMLAYVTFHHQERIRVSIESNKKKALRVRIGVFFGVAAPFIFIATQLIQTRL